MDGITQLVPRDRFLPLRPRETRAGEPRRAGIEIEFGELTEAEAADVVARTLGGTPREIAAHDFEVETPDLGRVLICLDTSFRDKAGSALTDLGLQLGRAVVPVEVVTPPLHPDQLPEAERLRGALRAAGARGSREGVFLGFGLHLNPEIPGQDAADLVPIVRAFALIEDWLRKADPIDPSRRLLPFVDPYPRSLIDRLASAGPDWSLEAFADAYLDETPTRNRGLDMLPCLAHLAQDRVAQALGPGAASIGARPTFHYRLPDCRIDEPGWRLAYEWNRWVMVERLAADTAALKGLAADWLDYRAALTTTRSDWYAHLDRVLCKLELWDGSCGKDGTTAP
ncbi:amidoligase family protein [Rhodovulum sulfidophilum]|uniref:amidoligase family protein n=1 Tax=Rhodovulum sulfidophilum TaxID=35806 RepID=UPI001922D4EC|nr:amidoligase family protein [Rhodovulum sulfidophilum]MBL3561785.1 amidoligase family protein [Rhodovulum sulfidophilum]